MRKCCSILLSAVLFFICHPTFAVNQEQLASIKETIKELCETPTKEGGSVSIEGAGEAGVIFKFFGIGVEGRVEKETWDGIKQLPDTQEARTDCVIALAGIFTENSPNLRETNEEVEDHEKIVELPCNVWREKRCLSFGASNCSTVRSIEGELIDTCRWEHIKSELACKRTYGLWATPQSRYALRHPGIVKHGELGSCTTSEYNLNNERYLAERRIGINK